MKPDDYYVVMEHYDEDLIGIFNNISAAKMACIEYAKEYDQETIANMEFGIYRVALNKKNRAHTYIAEFSGIELSEISND